MVTELEPGKAPVGDERVSRLAEALRREQRVSRALRDVGTALGTTLDLDDLLELILAKLTELVEADRATLYLLDEARNELVSRLVAGGEVRSTNRLTRNRPSGATSYGVVCPRIPPDILASKSGVGLPN